MRIAYQGEPGAYSEAAALRCAADADLLPCHSFEEVFAAVREGRASHGILPMENSIGGSIHRNYDLLVEHELPIVGEVVLAVDHCLMALPGTPLAGVRVVHSHPQALAQCERYLQRLANVEIVAVYDTAGGAKIIRQQQLRDAAAVASERAAEVFGLEVLARGIQDYDANVTRFVVVARSASAAVPPKAGEAGGGCKTSIVFTLPNGPGALFKALSVFAFRDINLTKLESRPLRGRPWDYLFYADLDVRRDSLECGRALVHLAEIAQWVRTLGSYAAWIEPAGDAASGPHPARVIQSW
ncbi:MAG TPA: prephenate dehydratase [Vicinamibacterales bacterium]|nr:prephenate dehydratase [Vicinamibacterales bacterium]